MITIAIISVVSFILFICWCVIKGGRPSFNCDDEGVNQEEDEDTVMVVNEMGKIEYHRYDPMGYHSLGV